MEVSQMDKLRDELDREDFDRLEAVFGRQPQDKDKPYEERYKAWRKYLNRRK